MRHGWLLVAALFVSSCAKEVKTQEGTWASFPVEIYSDSALVATNEARADFYAAMSFWEAKAGQKLFDYKGEWKGGTPYVGSPSNPSEILANVVFFQNPWPFNSNVAGQTTVISSKSGFHGSIILLNEGIARCSGNCAGENYKISQQKLLAHELGHFIGMSHNNTQGDIMYPTLFPGGSLESSSANTAALQQIVN